MCKTSRHSVSHLGSHYDQLATRVLVYTPKPVQIRALPSAFNQPGNRSHQAWFEDMLNFNWNASKRATSRLVNGVIDETQWADAFFDAILQANANAHWIGRDQVSDALFTEFGTEDILAGQSIADVDADYLQGFIDDILDGRYDDEFGELREDLILQRQRLYMGKARGIAGQAAVDNLPIETEITWVLGAVEIHCQDCPALAGMSPFFPDDLFTTPGACSTPCLGNCKCHLEFEVNGEKVSSIKPVVLEV